MGSAQRRAEVAGCAASGARVARAVRATKTTKATRRRAGPFPPAFPPAFARALGAALSWLLTLASVVACVPASALAGGVSPGMPAGSRPGPVGSALPDWVSCPQPAPAPTERLDALFQLSAWIRDDLQSRGAPVALVARSGLDLRALAHRYSHTGWLRPAGGWTVRQLYLDCREGRPRVFDEGLAGFVRGVSADVRPRISVVEWPDGAAQQLALTVGDRGQALALAVGRYRAQAPAWSVTQLNCNQWTVEMLAAAFGAAPGRAGAQRWLAEAGYQPSELRLPHWFWLLGAALSPYTGLAEHPPEDLDRLVFRVSMPASLEAWVQRRWPAARRTEWCLNGATVVQRRGWEPLDDHCTPAPGDELRSLSP